MSEEETVLIALNGCSGEHWKAKHKDAYEEAKDAIDINPHYIEEDVEVDLYRVPTSKLVQDWEDKCIQYSFRDESDYDNIDKFKISSFNGELVEPEPKCTNHQGHDFSKPNITEEYACDAIRQKCTRCNITRKISRWDYSSIGGEVYDVTTYVRDL